MEIEADGKHVNATITLHNQIHRVITFRNGEMHYAAKLSTPCLDLFLSYNSQFKKK